MEFFRVDAVGLEKIADAYGIESYPTYIFFRNGRPQRGTLKEPMMLGEARNWLELQLAGHIKRDKGEVRENKFIP